MYMLRFQKQSSYTMFDCPNAVACKSSLYYDYNALCERVWEKWPPYIMSKEVRHK